MRPDKEVKKEFKLKASKDYEKFYAVKVLREEGFMRKHCDCGTYFWTADEKQKTCGDPNCSGGFRFFENNPAKKRIDYIKTWKRFAKLFKKWGYTPIPRYPVTARWRDDTDFVQASIYDFQPFVVSGEVKPPANPLVVPQFCLRFNDIDNVGITGAHYVGFVMIGQHAFLPKEQFDQDQFFRDIHNWLKIGLGLPNEEITYHEDAWAGGGNFGPCMEYFSRGLELGNQVYMLYQQTPTGDKELKLRVLDMGMGHERNAWFTQGKSTSYETTFPKVCKKLKKITGIEVDDDLIKKFLPYSSYLNVDEVDDIDAQWQNIAKKLGTGAKELREQILPLAALYSVAEHSRALLVALSDGALPSNAGGGYNLRVILRRALSFIEKYDWDIYLPDVCEWHAKYLKPIFPELNKNLANVQKILDVEIGKFKATKEKSRQIVEKLVKEDINEERLISLYDSQGISPELIKEEAAKLGKLVAVPDNFFAKVAGLHEKEEQETQTQKREELSLAGIKETEAMYFNDYKDVKFHAKVVKIIGKHVLLDKTYFYPTSGGQVHDHGIINSQKVTEVFKQGPHIVHVMEEEPAFKEGEEVYAEIDFESRLQLSQNHTATHIVNAAARKVLGSHINQAGAKKTAEKAHIDLTHYESLTPEEEKKIEEAANKIVKENRPIRLSFIDRDLAEKRYGMSLYQGGAVPGSRIRVVDIDGVDVEACGGTHVLNTSEVGEIKILKSAKVQDGIVRVTFVAGRAAALADKKELDVLGEAAQILGVKIDRVPARAEELFNKWKLAKKMVKKEKEPDLNELVLSKEETFKGDCLQKTAEILKTQPEYIAKTIKRFLTELEEMKGKLKEGK